jgi:membrane-associated protease RseP (regulator of RpoE activity)
MPFDGVTTYTGDVTNADVLGVQFEWETETVKHPVTGARSTQRTGGVIAIVSYKGDHVRRIVLTPAQAATILNPVLTVTNADLATELGV